MLVTTRKPVAGQNTIQIGDDVFVKVVSIEGGKVRLGVTAPASTSIRRGEVPTKEADEAEQIALTVPTL
jgi:carbon storage regulator